MGSCTPRDVIWITWGYNMKLKKVGGSYSFNAIYSLPIPPADFRFLAKGIEHLIASRKLEFKSLFQVIVNMTLSDFHQHSP